MPLDEVQYAFRTTRIIPGSLARQTAAGRVCKLHAASPDPQGARIIDTRMERFEVGGTHE